MCDVNCTWYVGNNTLNVFIWYPIAELFDLLRMFGLLHGLLEVCNCMVMT